MQEYRVDIKVRNNLILSKIEELGFSSPLSFCQACNIPYPSLLNILNMKRSIYTSAGEIRPFVKKLCDFFKCLPEELFTANQAEACLKDNKRTMQVNEAEVKFMLEQGNNQKLLEDDYMQNQVAEGINQALNKLLPREKMVLEMRMGLNGNDVQTLEEIGKKMDISRERVRGIEAHALRKLRSPRISEGLRKFVEEE